MRPNIFKLTTLSLLVVVGFSACGEKSNTIIPIQEKWVWGQDDLTVTLDLYVTDNKYYSIVTSKISDNSDIKRVLFQNDTWTYYKMINDTTMHVRRENQDFPSENDRYNKWLIHQHTEKFLEMEYIGTLPTTPTITHYLFTPQE